MRSLYLSLLLLFITHIGISQCYQDRHSTSVYDSWVSDSPAANPNSARAVSHWIMYDLGATYQLGQMHLWNINDPDRLTQGLKNYMIDVSLDGQTWTEVGEYELAMAEGLSIYEGIDGPDLGGVKAQYLLVTAVNNHGDPSMYGLGEIRVDLRSEALGIELIDFNANCNEESIAELNWTAISDDTNEFFLLEKSIGAEQWETVAEVENQTGEGEQEYEFNSESEDREVMYRLSAVSTTGEVQLLKFATAVCDKVKDFEIFPNPFSTNTVVKLNGFANEEISYTLIDMLGKTIRLGEITVFTDGQTFDIEGDDLSAGQYILSINDGNSVYQQPIIFIADE